MSLSHERYESVAACVYMVREERLSLMDDGRKEGRHQGSAECKRIDEK